MRSRRAGLKRMGLLALALVIALGALGVAYAAWTDSVYVQGTVETGTLDINPIAASSMFVYKHPVTKDIIIDYPASEANPDVGYDTIAGAEAKFWNTSDDLDKAQIDFWGLYPCIEVKADIELQYFGTVPAKIYIAQVTPLDIEDTDYEAAEAAIIEALWTLGETSNQTQGIWIDGEKVSYPSGETTYFRYPDSTLGVLGVQLHQFDTVTITMHLYLPLITGEPSNPLDESNLVGRDDIDFSGHITVIQWNEYDDGS